jgi:hypothetical protein
MHLGVDYPKLVVSLSMPSNSNHQRGNSKVGQQQKPHNNRGNCGPNYETKSPETGGYQM